MSPEVALWTAEGPNMNTTRPCYCRCLWKLYAVLLQRNAAGARSAESTEDDVRVEMQKRLNLSDESSEGEEMSTGRSTYRSPPPGPADSSYYIQVRALIVVALSRLVWVWLTSKHLGNFRFLLTQFCRRSLTVFTVVLRVQESSKKLYSMLKFCNYLGRLFLFTLMMRNSDRCLHFVIQCKFQFEQN